MSNISLNHWDVNKFKNARYLQITKYIHRDFETSMYISLDVTDNLSKGGLMLIHFQAKRALLCLLATRAALCS